MQLDKISASIRYRTPWEGVDLGFVMARQWFWPLWRLWWMTAMPLTLLTAILLYQWPGVAVLIMWWLKPVYEPMLLFWLSRRLFGEELSIREAMGQWRSVLSPRLLANLTLRRLSPSRSFFMPVSHLEGLRGNERRKRLEVLSRGQSAASWLTIGGIHFEGILQFSLVLLIIYLIPDELRPYDWWEILSGEGDVYAWLTNIVAVIAMSIIAPFYVAGGFALYLTRRSALEAWDIELAFRRIAPRFKSTGSLAGLLLAGVMVLTTAWPISEAWAVEREHAEQVVSEVLAHEDFGTTQTEKYWRYIGEQAESNSDRSWDFSVLPIIAEILRLGLWVAIIILLGWLLIFLLRLMDWLPKRPMRRDKAAPTILFGMPITPESLPEDVSGSVNRLLNEGQIRLALSLLYRATLARLVHEHHVRIRDSATEGECQRIVQNQRPLEESDYFTRLTRLWIHCAYGHTPLQIADVSDLANSWQQVFGAHTDA